ncbi:MAG: hypothetical protein AAF639_16645, partial [Chloroflexota bacterium]
TGALLILLVQTPIVNRYLPDAIKTTANWVLTQPVMATLRGVVMGSSVALVIVGIRFIMGGRD